MKATFNRYCIGALIPLFAVASIPLQSITVMAVSPRAAEHANARAYKDMPSEAQNDKKQEVVIEQTVTTPPTETPAVTPTRTTAQTARTQDPAGNNGTVKIDRTPFDSHPDNQPHVTCSFQVDFYGFDAGVGNATVNFAMHAPTNDSTLRVTSGDLTPNIGEDAAGGGTDLDASETYTLAFAGTPHTKQGYHVKLTVNAPGSQGADTKHKVFWVTPCEEPTPVTPQTPGVILAEAASTTRAIQGAVLPAQLPSTGSYTSLWLIGMLAALSTYSSIYALQGKRLARQIQ